MVTKSFVVGLLTSAVNATYFYSCSEVAFCSRHTQFQNDQLQAASIQYNVSPQSITWNSTTQQITAELSTISSGILAQNLNMAVTVYEGGILRVLINETNGTEQRFRISSQKDFAVMESQLTAVTPQIQQSSTSWVLTDGDNQFNIQFSPFRIEQRVNGQLTLTLNDKDSLYFEASTGKNSTICLADDSLLKKIYKRMISTNNYPSYGTQIDYQMAIGLGARFETNYLYGLPERESQFDLYDTLLNDKQPYNFFNIDYYGHSYPDARGEYGSMPYVTGHSTSNDTSLMWMNSSQTWADLIKITENQRIANFVSESGQIELFIFGSKSPKTQLESVAKITGYGPLPPIESLGFHYSKYAEVTADIMIQRDQDFEDYGFPVDVYWMDILYAQDYQYFQFDQVKFPSDRLKQMNLQVQGHKRKLVAITDPHIKVTSDFFVYRNGTALENSQTQIFVHDCLGNQFQGDCWPGTSVWVDYLNENAQNYWKSLYRYDNFLGTTQIYSFWNDMNEPSVFGAEQQTLPLQSHHKDSQGQTVLHRDIHNAYGSLMHRTTHQGVLERDDGIQRAFVLTRSFFFGSQKYGAYWTGDNSSTNIELQGSVSTILSTGLAGMYFGGADIPGYLGDPSESLYITHYQLGIFYPFFRAHCDINNTSREPWIQTSKVQQVIRQAVQLRYSLIHYIYTTFNQATTKGTPVMRPMFLEFPDQENLFNLQSQFMFGDNILVTPKLDSTEDGNGQMQVVAQLPSGVNWFNYNTKLSTTESQANMNYNYWDIGMWVRGGTVLPILQHKNALSILRAVDYPLRLEVFLDQNSQAQGDLVVDDGWSTKSNKLQLHFSFNSNLLSVTSSAQSNYVSNKVITEVQFYGIAERPSSIINYLSGQDLTFEYSDYDQTVLVQHIWFSADVAAGSSANLLNIKFASNVIQ